MEIADVELVEVKEKRKGLYISLETRNQLNIYKTQRSAMTGVIMSQSEAIDELLDIARRWEQVEQLRSKTR